MTFHRFTALLACGVLAFGVAACGDDDDENGGGDQTSSLSGSIAGAGASSQAAAKEAWIAGFQTQNPQATVSYDAVGSGGGREQFIAGGTVFGGSDSPLAGDELEGAQQRCGGVDNLIQIPIYISPIAIVYNLDGVDELQLSANTLASIMKRDITNWNDPAIAADNPDADLPDLRITTVNRSDESGTTENFAEYMAAVAPDIWDFDVSGDWPVRGGEAAQGTSGVVDAVRSGEGTIGYADASQAGQLGVAQIGVGDEFVGPTPDAAGAILDASERVETEGQYVFTYELARDTTESGTYPIVLVAYEMACTQYDSANDAALLKGFLGYVVSEEGQQAAAEAAGSAPISDEFRELVTPAIEAIGGE
ncbi:MAG: phosphate ABC transporter substrate-binding protein PstS [Solirubrobacteraceae bacterium]|nr:phosphate ABC transporter substrate-binding protein PstS [Solirubrobacteraceae bacterium]